MRECGATPQDDDPTRAIPDLSRLPLDAVLRSDDSALDNALRRMTQDVGRPGENYAAHGTTPA